MSRRICRRYVNIRADLTELYVLHVSPHAHSALPPHPISTYRRHHHKECIVPGLLQGAIALLLSHSLIIRLARSPAKLADTIRIRLCASAYNIMRFVDSRTEVIQGHAFRLLENDVM